MANPIFRVDLAKDARDFQPTATEPGLGMLDRQGANFVIMRRWFGKLIAEPQWNGKDSVQFYIQGEEDDTRVERVDCYPVTKDDLEETLNDELKAIQARIKRNKPQSPSEQLLHRVVRQTFNRLTGDLDESDFDCYFFKYREARQPWHLVWCWGYQRVDQEPGSSLICTNSQCNQIFVRRADEKSNCPGCQTAVSAKGAGTGLLGRRRSRRTAALLAALLLVVAVLLFLLAGRPKLVVTPAQWAGSQGRQVEFQVVDKRWLLWKDDVTSGVVPISGDRRIIEFDGSGTLARARGPGRTVVSFRYRDRVVDATVRVDPPAPPDSIVVEPASVKLGIGTTKQLRVMGHYDDGSEPIDFTHKTLWEVEDNTIAYVDGGRLEGTGQGSTKVKAVYQHDASSRYQYATVDVDVAAGEYKSLRVRISPETLALGQKGTIEVYAVDAQGNQYPLIGSSRLALSVSPEAHAALDGPHLVANAPGVATLTASLGELVESFEFTVSDQSYLPAGTFVVAPQELDLMVGENVALDVTSASQEPVEAVSSDPAVVEVVRGTELVGRAVGSATVTVSQGSSRETVTVSVSDRQFDSLKIVPSIITLRVGQESLFRVVGTYSATDGSGQPFVREVDIAPDRLSWFRRPLSENVRLNEVSLSLFGLRPTDRPQGMIAYLGEELSAAANVNVVGGSLATTFDPPGDFIPHPPIGGGRQGAIDVGRYVGGGLRYTRRGVIIGDVPEGTPLAASRLPADTIITSVDGYDLIGLSENDIIAYFRQHPIVEGTRIVYQDPGGNVGTYTFGRGIFVLDVNQLEIRPLNLGAADFNAEVHLGLREKGEYRIVDSEGAVLSQWQLHGPEATVSFVTDKILRNAANKYELIVERRIGDRVEAFRLLPFSVEAASP